MRHVVSAGLVVVVVGCGGPGEGVVQPPEPSASEDDRNGTAVFRINVAEFWPGGRDKGPGRPRGFDANVISSNARAPWQANRQLLMPIVGGAANPDPRDKEFRTALAAEVTRLGATAGGWEELPPTAFGPGYRLRYELGNRAGTIQFQTGTCEGDPVAIDAVVAALNAVNSDRPIGRDTIEQLSGPILVLTVSEGRK